MQRRQGVVAAGVAGDQVQAGHRHVELGFLGVLQLEEFRRLTFDLQGDQALIAAHAVVDVHHRCAFAQLGEVLDDVLAGIAGLLAAAALHDALTEQRAFGDQRQLRLLQQQPVVQRGDADRQAFLAGEKARPAVDFLRTQLQAGQQFQQHFAATGRFGGEQHATGELVEKAPQRPQRLAGLGFDGQLRQHAGGKALTANAGFYIFLAGDHARPQLETGEAVLHRYEQIGGRQQRALGIDAAFLKAVAHILPELLGGLLDARQGKYLGVLGQVVEQGRGLVEEQRQVVLDARRCDAGGEVLIDRAAAEIHVEALTEACAKASDRFLLHREFAGRQQAHRIDLFDGALVFWVEGAQRLDLVVKQIDAIGQGAAHREQVDQRAAHGELAMLVHRIHAAITRGFQARTHLFDVELLADIQHQARPQQEALGRQAV